MSNYVAGTHMGKVTDYGISESKSGEPQVFVGFDVEMPQGPVSMTWFGSLKEGKAQEITLKALLVLGFRGKNGTELLDGPESGMIDIGREAKLVCEEQEWQGKKSVRIMWINSPQGNGSGVKRADPNSMKAKLLKLNLAGELAKAKADNPALDASDQPF